MQDFNAQVRKEQQFRKTLGSYPAQNRTNTNDRRLIELCDPFDLKLMSINFKICPMKKIAWCSPQTDLGEF